MKLTRFQKIATTALVTTILLIGIGGLVRATGSGLGCPDWPHCFGSWVPPTSAEQLPPGFDKAEFNLYKTWTEYLNRWAGVIVGFAILAMFVSSLQYRKSDKRIFYLSLSTLLLVMFQGWLGGRVVTTELKPLLITLHMILAMIILGLILYTLYRSFAAVRVLPTLDAGLRGRFAALGIAVLAITLVQVIIGTQVREVIDTLMKTAPNLSRERWLEFTGLRYNLHRSFSWLVLLLGAWMAFRAFRLPVHRWFRLNAALILVLIISQALIGIVLQNFAMPPVFQILHLFNSSLLVCAELVFVFSVVSTAKSPAKLGRHEMASA